MKHIISAHTIRFLEDNILIVDVVYRYYHHDSYNVDNLSKGDDQGSDSFARVRTIPLSVNVANEKQRWHDTCGQKQLERRIIKAVEKALSL